MEPPRSDLAALRAEYELGGLSEADLTPDPLTLFDRWFTAAAGSGLVEANAMVLATVGEDGPASRTVLLKGYDERGFVFFTNYASRKGEELAADPRCALLFGWYPLQRQIRIEGTATKVDRSETEAYFASRPRSAQLGAWASPQSSPVASRDELDGAYAELEARFGDADIPAPDHWGGYRVEPASVEFWQGRTGRMHDRIRYQQTSGGWRTTRLAP